ncbi:hypothetical protein V6N12_020453 [Hibiscus sabdariffa]|uniref:Uncharacterized protein n=1 Tax=Hibiscus sabdariffa TaxID=183260 RepID=A0ABR2CY48_9ROSI
MKNFQILGVTRPITIPQLPSSYSLAFSSLFILSRSAALPASSISSAPYFPISRSNPTPRVSLKDDSSVPSYLRFEVLLWL